MEKFFKNLLKRILQIIVIIAIIWLLFFLINFFNPKLLLSFNKELSSLTKNEARKIPLKYKIYNLFFKNSNKNLMIHINKIKNGNVPVWSKPYTIIKTEEPLLKNTNNYINLSEENTTAIDFEFDNIKVKEENNILKEDTIIKGKLSTNYILNPYVFFVDIYNENMELLYDLRGEGLPSTDNVNYFDVIIKNKKDFNIYNYTGKGYLVIWGDDKNNNIVISKIEIE